MRTRLALIVSAAACGAIVVGRIRAGDCTFVSGPDVIVGDLTFPSLWGTLNGLSAYSIGTTSCNVGDTVLQWDADTNNHPVIGQNIYRLRDGRFEQLGYSWLKHGFAAVTGSTCCTCQVPGNTQLLGVGCSDPYGSTLNGDQDGFNGCGGLCGGLGARWEVNATTGEYPYPYDGFGESGNVLFKRIQVANDDLDPALNGGAKYYGEGHYVAPDDAAAAHHHNNASYKELVVGAFQDGWEIALQGDTTQGLPAIWAWQDNDPEVQIVIVEDDDNPADDHDGRFHLGYRATDNGDGTWHYEYALHNLNSHRSARAFSLSVSSGVNITGVGFKDIDRHSGDGEGGINHNGSNWPFEHAGSTASWSTATFTENSNANAVRWGTLYNFWFDADAGPVAGTATLGLFRPGTPESVTTTVLVPGAAPCPADCGDTNGIVDTVDFLALLAEWTQIGTPCDINGGGVDTTDFLDLLANWGPCP